MSLPFSVSPTHPPRNLVCFINLVSANEGTSKLFNNSKEIFGKIEQRNSSHLEASPNKSILVHSSQLFSHVEFSKTLHIVTTNESCVLLHQM